MTKQDIINRLELINDHDCKLSEDGGCETCQEIYTLKQSLKALEEVTEEEWAIEGLSHWGASERSQNDINADINDGEIPNEE